MIIFDFHCDTISKIHDSAQDLQRNTFHVDIEKIPQDEKRIQFFAVFVKPGFSYLRSLLRTSSIISKYYEQINANSKRIEHCNNCSGLFDAIINNKIASFLSIENAGEIFMDKLNIKSFYNLGVRCMGLTWNYDNMLGCGAFTQEDKGLSEDGRQVIEQMQTLGILLDVSHLSEKTFWDAAEWSYASLVASHSNCRSICNSKRNLTDEQIKHIANTGGIIGINFYPEFLNNSKTADINDVIRHIEHVCSIAGPQYVCIGSDFDGIEETPTGLEDTSKINNIFEMLSRLNYSEKDIANIASANFLRVASAYLS